MTMTESAQSSLKVDLFSFILDPSVPLLQSSSDGNCQDIVNCGGGDGGDDHVDIASSGVCCNYGDDDGAGNGGGGGGGGIDVSGDGCDDDGSGGSDAADKIKSLPFSIHRIMQSEPTRINRRLPFYYQQHPSPRSPVRVEPSPGLYSHSQSSPACIDCSCCRLQTPPKAGNNSSICRFRGPQ